MTRVFFQPQSYGFQALTSVFDVRSLSNEFKKIEFSHKSSYSSMESHAFSEKGARLLKIPSSVIIAVIRS